MIYTINSGRKLAPAPKVILFGSVQHCPLADNLTLPKTADYRLKGDVRVGTTIDVTGK